MHADGMSFVSILCNSIVYTNKQVDLFVYLTGNYVHCLAEIIVIEIN